MNARYVFVVKLLNIYRNKNIPISSETDISIIASEVIGKIAINLLENTKRKTFNPITLDSTNVVQYNTFLQSIIDKLIFDCHFLNSPINLDLNEAHRLIVDTEAIVIESICAIIPNIDDSNIVINCYEILNGFGLFITLIASLNEHSNNNISA